MSDSTENPVPETTDEDANTNRESSSQGDSTKNRESSLPASGKGKTVVAFLLAIAIAFSFGTFFGGDETEQTHDHTASEEATIWTCSMHPQVQSPEPGACPICGMDLIPLSESGPKLADNEVKLTERARKLAQVRTTRVARAGDAEGNVHLLGLVEEAETGEKVVTAWTGGRLDRLRVKTTGQKIRRGQVIADIYSPEIYAAHRDLLVAKEQVERLANGSEFALKSADTALESARQKLRLLGVPEKEIARLEKSTKPATKIAIRTPFGGTVTERLVSEGNYVKPGTGLYRISDLSSVWVQLDAYPNDLSLMTTGQKVSLTFNAYPDEEFEGEVAFIDPVVNPRTRTARVRVEVENPDGKLRPGMFAEAAVSRGEGGGAGQLVIPDTAPILTGSR